MTTLDIEGLLRDHMFSMGTNKCVCGVGPRRGQVWFDHRTHVAAVLREQIAEWLGSEALTVFSASPVEVAYRKGWNGALSALAAVCVRCRYVTTSTVDLGQNTT